MQFWQGRSPLLHFDFLPQARKRVNDRSSTHGVTPTHRALHCMHALETCFDLAAMFSDVAAALIAVWLSMGPVGVSKEGNVSHNW